MEVCKYTEFPLNSDILHSDYRGRGKFNDVIRLKLEAPSSSPVLRFVG